MTLAEFRTLVRNWSKRPNKTDAEVDTLINMAMHNLEDEYNFRRMKKESTGTISTDTITIPSDYKSSFALIIIDALITDSVAILDKTDYKQLLIEHPLGENYSTVPASYANDDANNSFILRPYPDTDYDYEFHYYGYSTDLSDANPSNFWLTSNLWDLLLFATLLLYEPFLKNMPNPETNDIAVWRGLYEARLAKVKKVEIDEQVKGSYRSITPHVIV